ncbi:unnamed protein product [Nesidiocoris tenuis]|uniref:Uncharacterized protein n=1 Tax=Nesidiocoris tenuis TaxID=355587 RepID=A0A6H5HS72_9HEMI|nr:unnamed protein product [Nesidiocoris tenuis]
MAIRFVRTVPQAIHPIIWLGFVRRRSDYSETGLPNKSGPAGPLQPVSLRGRYKNVQQPEAKKTWRRSRRKRRKMERLWNRTITWSQWRMLSLQMEPGTVQLRPKEQDVSWNSHRQKSRPMSLRRPRIQDQISRNQKKRPMFKSQLRIQFQSKYPLQPLSLQ